MPNSIEKRFIVPKQNLLFYILGISILVAYLFYLDEGNFNYDWMSEPGAWFVYCIYCFIFFIVVLLIDAFTFRSLSGWKKAAITYIIFLSILICFVMMTMT